MNSEIFHHIELQWWLNVSLKSLLMAGGLLVMLQLLKTVGPAIQIRIVLIAMITLLFFPVLSHYPIWKITLPGNHALKVPIIEPSYNFLLENEAQEISSLTNSSKLATGLQAHPSKALLSISLPQVGLILWALIALIVLFREFLSLYLWKRQLFKCQESIPKDWKASFEQLNLNKRVRIICSRGTNSPVAFGIIHPTIALPAKAKQWDIALLDTVLKHELAHIQHHDTSIKWLLHVVKAIYWFNPLIWLVQKQVHLLMELRCDQRVISEGVKRQDYAAHLLFIARQNHLEISPKYEHKLVLSMAQLSELKQRFEYLLNPSPSKAQKSTRWSALILLPIILLSGINVQPSSKMNDWEAPQLVKQLYSDNTALVQTAIHALVAQRREECSASLLALLNHNNPQVRATAAWGIGQLKEATAVTQLLNLMDDQDSDVKEKVLLSLAEFGYSKTYYQIKPLTNHNDPKVRKAALWALSSIGCVPAFVHTCIALNDSDDSVKRLAERLIQNWDQYKLEGWMQRVLQNNPQNTLLQNSLSSLRKEKLSRVLVEQLGKSNEQSLELILEYLSLNAALSPEYAYLLNEIMGRH